MKEKKLLPYTDEKGYYEIRMESIGGLGANLAGKMLGELGALGLGLNASGFASYGSEKKAHRSALLCVIGKGGRIFSGIPRCCTLICWACFMKPWPKIIRFLRGSWIRRRLC